MEKSTGYSGTPLSKKLGIKKGFNIALANPPEYYFDLFQSLPEGLIFHNHLEDQGMDFIHLFCTTKNELIEMAPKYINLLKKTGMLWVSWPKGSSKIPTNLKRDIIREYLLSMGVVDTKVAAIDEQWSGLKFVYRLKDR